jgi:hypothetical protein
MPNNRIHNRTHAILLPQQFFLKGELKMKKHLALLLGVLYLLHLQAYGAETNTIQQIIQNAYPGAKIELLNDKEGTLDKDELTVPFTLSHQSEFLLDKQSYVLLILDFEEYQRTVFTQAMEMGHSLPFSYSATLLVAPKGQPEKVKKVVLDDKAILSRGYRPMTKDFLGTGPPQLQLRVDSTYFNWDHEERINANLFCLFSLPELDTITRLTESRHATREDMHAKPLARAITFEASQDGQKEKHINIRDKIDGTVKILKPENGKYLIAEKLAWQHQATYPQKGLSSKSTIIVHVEDEMGNPISEAQIGGATIKLNLLTAREIRTPIEAVSDEKGNFSLALRGNLTLRIRKEGYYTYEKSYTGIEFRAKKRHTIVMRKEHEAVEMFRDYAHHRWEGIHEVMEYGISFVPDLYNSPPNTTQNRKEADIWVEIIKMNDPKKEEFESRKRWVRSIRNGWKIFPGPTAEHQVSKMKQAPEKGYCQTLEYKLESCPKGFYVQKDNGTRYGKLAEIGFSNTYRNDKPKFGFGIG